MSKRLNWNITFIFLIFTSFVFSQIDSTITSDSTLVPPNITIPPTVENDSLANPPLPVVIIPQDTLWIQFIKGNQTHSPDSTLFDIIKIQNTSSITYAGALSIELPSNWKLISQKELNISLAPGESYYFPVRISLPDQLIGGYSYVLSANFNTEEHSFQQNLYITIPKKSDWGIEVTEQNIYFNALYDYINYNYYLYNNGNAEEIIKVNYEIGKMLDLPEIDNVNNEAYYVLAAHSDTTISHRVQFRKGLSDFEKERYENNFRESMVMMRASTSEKNENRRVLVNRLNSEYDNHKGIYNYQTPLNVEWQTYNLLSPVSPRFNIRAYGKILFNNSRQLDYHIAALSLPFGGSYNNVTFAKNAFFRVLYTTPTSSVLLASNIGGSNLLNSYGMGLAYKQQLAVNARAEVVVTRDRFLPISSASLTGEFDLLPFLTGRLGFGVYDDSGINQTATSALIGSRFMIGKNHRFDIDLAFSYNVFKATPALPQEEERLGFSYRFRYNVSLTKFNLRVYSLNKSLNYFRNSNNYINQVNGSYVFDQKNRLNLNFYANYYLLDVYPYRFLRLDSWTRNLYGQLLYLRPITPKLFLNVGPEVSYNYRDIYIVSDDYNTQLENLFYGAYLAMTYRFDQYSSITPNLRIGLAQTDYRDVLNGIDIETDLQFALRLGVNYTGKYLRVLAYYQRGPLNIVDQAIISNQVLPTQESYQLRPYYERFFFDHTLRLSGYVNFIYLMPANRELFNWSIQADVYLDDGWELGVSNNMYSNKYVNSEQNIVANRGLNLFLRVKKSFGIQQPRVKFYNMDIVYFKDMNGNGVKDKDELPIPNVKTVIERHKEMDSNRDLDRVFVSQYLVSNPEGEINMENIPHGVYSLNHQLLQNGDNLFFVYGKSQEVILNGDQTIYAPLTESYKIRGKIILDRDLNSNLGDIDISEIRVTAVSDSGDTYFGLTDDYGQYIIHVPPGQTYTVTINNVLDESLVVEKDEYRIDMIDVKTVNVDFNFIEKRRGLNIEGEQIFDFNLDSENN